MPLHRAKSAEGLNPLLTKEGKRGGFRFISSPQLIELLPGFVSSTGRAKYTEKDNL